MQPSWSTPRHERPTWRGVLHAVAFVLAIPGSAALVLAADGSARVAVAVYGLSLLLAFGSSAAYHRLHLSEEAQRILQRVDHSMIFVLIAGSYTPLCIVALPSSWGLPLLATVWALGALGIGLKIFGFERFKNLGYSLYPIIGWLAAVAMPVLYRSVSPLVFGLVVASGLLYTIGIPVLMRGRPNPWPRTFGYHEVWHTFTVLAGACHFVAVMALLR